jgi:two-component system, sensor histidine kinase
MKKVIRIWNSLALAGTNSLRENDIQSKTIVVGINKMCLSIIILNLIVGIAFKFIKPGWTIFAGTLTEGLALFTVVGLNYYKKFTSATILFYIIINAATAYFAAILGPSAEVEFMSLLFLVLSFFLFKKTGIRVACIIITISLVAFIEINFKYKIIEPLQFSQRAGYFVRLLSISVIFILLGFALLLYKRTVELDKEKKDVEINLDSEEKQNIAKSQLFQHYSHDIRGAYFGVSSICTLLQISIEEKKEVNPKLVDELVNASENYKFLLDHFLDYSKTGLIGYFEYQEVKITDELRKIIHLNKYLALKKKVDIKYSIERNVPDLIITDRLIITRVFMNLLNNAIKFTRQGSTVSVNVARENSTLKLTVTDQGEGIPEALRKIIFDPFVTEQTPQNPDGTGLGLYITKYLVDLLKGKIEIKSTIGVGSSFEVSLPLESE